MFPAILRNSIFSRELLRAGRSWRVFMIRALTPLAITVLMLSFVLAKDPQAGIHSFQWLTVFLNVFVLVAMTTLVSGVLHEEWQANTLSVLLLTETTLSSILQGLLTSRMVLVLANLLACFPLLISLMVFGGVTAAQLLQFSVLMIPLSLFYGAFSLWCTTVLRSREKALGLTLFALALPQVFAVLFVTAGSASPSGALSWLPSVAMLNLTEEPLRWFWGSGASETVNAALSGVVSSGVSRTVGAHGADWLSLGGLYLLLALGFFFLSSRRLESQLEAGQGASAETVVKVAKPHTPVRGNPVSWLVLKRFDPLLGIPGWPAVGVAIALTLLVELVEWGGTARAVLGVTGIVVMAWTFFWACVVSAQMWMEERAERTIELLLATPFTLDEIVLWKVDALFWALVSPTILYSVLVFNLVHVTSGSPVVFKALLLLPCAVCCFLYSYVGLLVLVYLTIFFAIKSTSTVHAVLLTLGSVTGIGLFNFFAIRLGGGEAILLALLVDMVVFVLFLPAFRRRLKLFEPL